MYQSRPALNPRKGSLSGTVKECIIEDNNENALDSLLNDIKIINRTNKHIENNVESKRNKDISFGIMSSNII